MINDGETERLLIIGEAIMEEFLINDDKAGQDPSQLSEKWFRERGSAGAIHVGLTEEEEWFFIMLILK